LFLLLNYFQSNFLFFLKF